MSSFSESKIFIKHNYKNREVIPLFEPKLHGNEKQYLLDCIDSAYVSSVGASVDRFELMLALNHKQVKLSRLLIALQVFKKL
jgi:hypothetical protein